MRKSATAQAAAAGYARLTLALIALGADGPADNPHYTSHYQWALGAPRDWLVSESATRLRRHRCFAPAGSRG